ncbi:hypothetical protein FQN53_001776 [Emmonsiellopsis sp. PD_33]|nr:hypothetical protein FQN53_001776 [Emmonsiellopsis sp. PD_33]
MRLKAAPVLLALASSFCCAFAADQCLKPTPKNPICAAPIPLPSLATVFPPPKDHPTASIEAIRNTLALYPFAIDGKNFAALEKIFAEDVVANYSAPLNVLSPLSTVQTVLEASLAPVTTHHSFGTQLIEIISPKIAQSVTYYQAAHFGSGDLVGEVAYAYGQYQDTWHKQKDHTWKIVYRNLVYMSPLIGNQAVFLPQN